MLYVQMIGRGLRTADGKSDCLILDHSDTTLRLGFVTDIQKDRLDDGIPKAKQEAQERKAPLPKECPACTLLKPAGTRECPACGFKPEKSSQVDVQEGELVELDGRKQAKANREAGWPEKVNFIRQLRAFAVERGRSSGWVARAYRDKFGVWPNDPRVRDAEPAAGVDPAVRSWIKSKDIRFAKRRKAQAA